MKDVLYKITTFAPPKHPPNRCKTTLSGVIDECCNAVHFTKGFKEVGLHLTTPKNAALEPQSGEPMEGFIRSHACQTPKGVGGYVYVHANIYIYIYIYIYTISAYPSAECLL